MRAVKTVTDSAASLRGTIERIVFYDRDDGFTAARLWSAEDASTITVVGRLIGVQVGAYVAVEGGWRSHPQRGRYFHAKKFSFQPPTTTDGIREYLTSGLIDGINSDLAARIARHFGLDTIKVIEETPQRLRELDGLGPTRINRIRRAWAKHKESNALAMLLQSPQISTALALRIWRVYSRAKQRHSPRTIASLSREVYALDFRTADAIGRALGVRANAAARVEACLRDALARATEQGHTFVPRHDLVRQCARALDIAPERVERAIPQLARRGEIVVEDNTRKGAAAAPRSKPPTRRAASPKRVAAASAIYPKPFHAAEVSVARRLRQLASGEHARRAEFEHIDWPKAFNWLAVKYDIILTRQQQGAVKTALTAPLSILTGGPGTGKTATLRALVLLLKRKGYSFKLAAPTGRAAKRLSEATGEPSQTLHRLLEFKPVRPEQVDGSMPQANVFRRNGSNPLRADLIIVDEVSMLDLLLMNDLVSAIEPGSHMLFVGDPDQLPSVGVGRVLHDLIDSQAIPVITLDKIFRQANGSLIVANAHRLNRGQLPVLSEAARDFIVIPEHEPRRATARIVNLVTTLIPRLCGFDSFEDIQVLSPMHQGPAGVGALNAALQAALNPPAPGRQEWRHAGRILRVGDKVLQTRNNYRQSVFNGDVGRIAAIDLEQQMVCVYFEGRRIDYLFSDLDELTHAFAMSVHKAQGGEYRAVVIPLLHQHRRMLQRNLLYTAITRAQELVVLVGTREALRLAVGNNKMARRHSRLGQRLASARAGSTRRD